MKLFTSFLFNIMFSIFPLLLSAEIPGWNWAVPVHSGSSEMGLDVAADPNSEFVYMVGQFDKDLDPFWGDLSRPSTDFSDGYGGKDGFVAKYDSAGNCQWAFKIGSTGEDEVRSVTVDADGNIYITGYVNNGVCQFAGKSSLTPDSSFLNTDNIDFFLAKYNSDGALLWVRNCDGSTDDVYGNDVIASSSGIYAAGHYQGILNFGSRSIPDYESNEDLFIVKYNPDGNLVWMLSGGGNNADLVNDLTSNENNIYLIGQYNSDMLNFRDTTGSIVSTLVNPNPGKDVIFILNTEIDSDFGWSVQISSSGNNEGNGICMDSDSLYIAGAVSDLSFFPSYTSNPVNVSNKKDVFLASLSKDNGSTGWVRTADCTDGGDEIAHSIAADLPGNLYIAGEYKGDLDFHGDTLISAISNEDLFIASYSSGGSFQWAKTAGSLGKEVAYGISTDHLANIYLTGSYSNNIHFDSDTLPFDVLENIFLADIHIVCAGATGGTALAATDHICLNDTASIGLTGYFGMIQWQSSPYGAYIWTDIAGAHSPTLNPVPADTTDYRAFISREYCTPDSSNVVTIFFYPLPTLTLPAALDHCNGDSLDIQLDFSMPSPWDIGYTTGADTTFITDITANPYFFRVSPSSDTVYNFVYIKDGNTCVSVNAGSVSVTVYEQPVADAGNDTVILLGTTIKLKGSGGVNFEWAPASGLSNAMISNPDASPIITTTYTLTVISLNGCIDTDEVTITVQEPEFANAGEDQALCYGGSVRLRASGGISYSWSPREGLSDPEIPDPEASPEATATYTVEVINSDGIVDSDEVTIIVYPKPVIGVITDISVCEDDKVELNASGEGSFQWEPATYLDNPAIANPVASPLSDIDYKLVLTDRNGCKDSVTVSLKVDLRPVVYAGEDMELNYKFDTMMDAGIPAAGEGEWFLLSGSGEFMDNKDPKTGIAGLSIGENILKWSVKNGVCPLVSDEITILVNDLYTPNVITPNFDNRNDEFVIPGLENTGPAQIIIFNRWGNEVFKADDYQNNWGGRDMDENELPADTYFYVLSFESGRTLKGYIIIKR